MTNEAAAVVRPPLFIRKGITVADPEPPPESDESYLSDIIRSLYPVAVIVQNSVKLLATAVFDNKVHPKGTVLTMDRSLAELYEKAGKGEIVPTGTPSEPEPEPEPETTRADRPNEIAVTRQGRR